MMAQTTMTSDQMFLNALDALDRETRINVGTDAVLYRAGEQYDNVYIVNLSAHGVRVICDSPPLVGEAVKIELADSGLFEGVVRWRKQDNFGVHIFESIDVSLYFTPQEY